MTSDNTALDYLHELDNLFADEAHWTAGEAARDKDGNAVGCTSEDAVRWCIVGGIDHVTIEGGAAAFRKVDAALRNTIEAIAPTCTGLVGINELGQKFPDESGRMVTGLPAIRAVIKATIKRLEADDVG